MKKILAVSLCAIMAVSAARADIASVEYVEGQTGVLTNLTTTAKGNLVGAINELNTAVGTKAAQADLTSLQGTVSTLTGTVSTNKEAAEKTQQDLDALEATVAGLQGTGETAAATKGELNALDARVGTAEGEIDALQASLATGGDTQKAIAAAQAAASVAQATADKAVVANTAITAGTATKITYDAKGLVTKGEALTATDIPTIGQDKVSGLTAALTAKEATANKVASSEAATTIGKTVAYPTVSFMETYVGQVTNGLVSDVGDVEELTTENTDSLVDAINEVDAEAAAKLATVSSSGSGVVKTVVKDGTTVKVTAGTVGLADMAANSVDSSKIVDASVAKTDLATAVQTSLGLADTAMQESALKRLASWTSAKCGTTGVTCSLVSKDGTIAWEAVKY